MPGVHIARTGSGKIIAVDQNFERNIDVIASFRDFSELEKFDALMALEYAYLREVRRPHLDLLWLKAIELYIKALRINLGESKIMIFKFDLGLNSAFDARDYGAGLALSHFRP